MKVRNDNSLLQILQSNDATHLSFRVNASILLVEMKLKCFIHARENYTELPHVKKRSYETWGTTFSFPFFTVMEGSFRSWNSVLQKFAHFSGDHPNNKGGSPLFNGAIKVLGSLD